MKKSLKCLSVILVMLITLFSFSVTALAQTTEQDGLQVSLTTDKQSYSLNENIEITVSVTNTNDFTVEDVSIEALLPDNFELKDSKQETSAKAIDLKAGEQTTLSVIAVVKGEEQSTTEPTEPSTDPTDTTKPAETTTQSSQATTSQNGTSAASPLNVKETTTNNSNKSQTTTTEKSKSTNSKNRKSPYTGGDYALLAVFFVIFFFSLAGLLYGLIVHTKKTKKAVSSVLCFVIAVTSVIGFTSYKAYADDRETSTISISEKIKVDNKDYTVSANVKYQVGGINLTIDNKENTVTDFNQILSGTFSSTSNVVSVTYTIATEIDDYEITDSGNANINDNRYSADIQLKPENNKITVTATTSTDKRESKTVNIKYNSGNSYELDKNHIVYDSKTNTEYVDNVVLILFDEGVTDTRRNEIISQIDGKLVGTANGINQWEVEISKRNLDELEKLCEELKHIDGVFAAHVDKIVKISPDIIGVNDPWENANGGNWYLGAIDAWSAWDYNERFNEINIGIVDNGFDTEHEDLIGKIAFPNKESQQNNSLEQHGTHVAGIIGAKENNNIGVTGLLWKSKLYCVDWQPTENQKWDTINEIMSGLRLTVEAGAKVVNFSVGMTSSYTYDECINNLFDTNSSYASDVMVELLNKNKDFVVVQSAGNGTSDGYAVDTKYNGLFASISKSDITIPEKSKFSKQDILNRIIIVGNAQKNDDGTYQQHFSSNGGEMVDICAPGTDIFSTIPGGDNGSYVNLTGTSMAAPVVTAVCGMVWSANNKLTGAEVKDIICNSYDKNIWVWDNTSEKHTTQNNYRMVNAKLSVEEALKGSISGCVKEASDGTTPIVNIEVRAVNENGIIIEKTKTDENGNFTLSLVAGDYTLSIGSTSLDTEYSYENYSQNITIESNVWTVLKDKILLNRITNGIAGNVFDSETKEPLENVEVRAYKDNDGTAEYISSSITNENGEYTVNVGKNGVYSLEFIKDGYTTGKQDGIIATGKITYADYQYLDIEVIDIVLHDVGDTIEFGSYPQSEVTDKELLSELNSLSLDWTSYEYCRAGHPNITSDYMKYADVIYNGNKYRAVTFSEYRPYYQSYSTTSGMVYGNNQAENGYYIDTIYWFKYEPLVWKILNPTSGLIICENIIDSQAFSNIAYSYKNYLYNNTTYTTYANDYATSSIREWLNDDFYNTAFSSYHKRNINTTELNNSAFSSAFNYYDSETTYDKVFLLSYNDMINSNYGFSMDNWDDDIERQAKGSNYAKCQGLWVASNGNSNWRLRTAGNNYNYPCSSVIARSDGDVSYYGSYVVNPVGIRPAISLKISD